MSPTFSLDLTQSLQPAVAPSDAAPHGAMPAPEGERDAARGQQFPLAAGGLMFASGGIIDDAAGTLAIEFTLRESPRQRAALIQAWGQYEPMLAVLPGKLELRVYNTVIVLAVRWEKNSPYTLCLAWDHRAGITLSLRPEGGNAQTMHRRVQWQAYRQSFVPFSIGGIAAGHRFNTWEGSFDGWIRSVEVWSELLEVPGPTGIDERGSTLPDLVPPAPGIAVLEIDNPPIAPDPHAICTLPPRLDDLRQTREVSGIESVIAAAKTELELFAAITHWVGNLWPHCHYWPYPANEQRHIFWKRGHEMLPPIKAGTMGGMCGGYAHVMEELFWSLGYDARRIQVTNHSSFEAYSNELDRWIICDASYNADCHFLAATTGELLGCGDIIRRHEALEYNPNALRDVRRLVCREENLHDAGFFGETAALYDHLGIALGKGGPEEFTTSPHIWYFREPERATFRDGGMGAGQKDVLADSLETLYPSRNRLEVTTRWAEPGAVLAINLTPVAVTFFETIEVTTDAGNTTCDGVFQWRLHNGVNTLTARTRNHLGARGYPLKLMIWKGA